MTRPNVSGWNVSQPAAGWAGVLVGLNPYQRLVEDFHRAMPCPIGDYANPKIARPELRTALIDEEARETCDAIECRDMVEVADGICDVLYVTYGAAVEAGIALGTTAKPYQIFATGPRFREEGLYSRFLLQALGPACASLGLDDCIFAQIHLTRLAQVCYDMAAQFSIDLEPLYQEVHRTNMLKASGPFSPLGKKLKPPGWTPPRIAELLAEQGWKTRCLCRGIDHEDSCPLWVLPY